MYDCRWLNTLTLFLLVDLTCGLANPWHGNAVAVHQGAQASGPGQQDSQRATGVGEGEYRLPARQRDKVNLPDANSSRSRKRSSNNFNNSLLSVAKLPFAADALHRRIQNYKTFTAETRSSSSRTVQTDAAPPAASNTKHLATTTPQSNITVQQDSKEVGNNSFFQSETLVVNENETSVPENLTIISVPVVADSSIPLILNDTVTEEKDVLQATTADDIDYTTVNVSSYSTDDDTFAVSSSTTTARDFEFYTSVSTDVTDIRNASSHQDDNTTAKHLAVTTVSNNYQVINSFNNISENEAIAIVTMASSDSTEKVFSYDNVSIRLQTHDNRSHFSQAKAPWNIAWDVHVYFLGALFVMVLSSCIIIVVCNCLQRSSTSGAYLITNAFVFIVASTRSFLLLYDAYNVNNSLSPLVTKLLFDLTFPSLTSGFALIFVELLQSINLKCKCAKYLRTNRVSVVIFIHYIIIIASDVVSVHLSKYNELLYFLAQTLCTIWTLVLFTTYFNIYQQLFLAALRKQGEIIRLTFTKLHIEGAPLPSNLPKPYLSLAVRLLLSIAILGVLLTCFHFFGLILVCDFLPGGHLTFWPWWTYHSCSRMIELSLCLLLLIVTCLNSTKTSSHKKGRIFHLCQRLFQCCSCRKRIIITNDDIYPTYHVSNAAVARTHFTFERWDASLPVTLCNPEASNPSPTPLSNQNVIKHFLPIEGTTNGSSLSSRYLPSATLLSSASDCYRSLGSRRQVVRATMTTLSDIHNRPPSMLFNENGFIRFRDPHDPEQPMMVTDEDGLVEIDRTHPALNEEKIVISDSMKRAIRGSHETDVSSADQWSTCNNHSGIGTLRRHGSTCSSESATTSFDVHLFLHPTPLCGTKTMKLCSRRSANTTPNKEKSNFIVGNRVSCGTTMARPTAPPHLNLTPNARVLPMAPGGQNIQDITPDSAVFLELPTPTDENGPEPGCSSVLISNFSRAHNQRDLAFSQSLNDLLGQPPTPNKLTPRHRGRSRSLLSRLKGSTFSLASHHGYEPLESKGHSSQTTLGRMNKLWRTNSEDSSMLQPPKDYRRWEMRTVFRDSGASSRMSRERHRDSFYDSDLSSTTGSRDCIHYVDTEVQTDPVDFSQIDKSGQPHEHLKPPLDIQKTVVVEPVKKEQESAL